MLFRSSQSFVLPLPVRYPALPGQRAGRGHSDPPPDAAADTPEKPRLFLGCPKWKKVRDDFFHGKLLTGGGEEVGDRVAVGVGRVEVLHRRDDPLRVQAPVGCIDEGTGLRSTRNAKYLEIESTYSLTVSTTN